MNSERALAGVALALLATAGGRGIGRLSAPERAVAERAIAEDVAPGADPALLDTLRARIAAGEDPLGAAFSGIRDADSRRRHGQVLTPPAIVAPMIARAVAEAARRGEPARVVDGGAGTGRYLLAAGRAFPRAALVAVETDPLCAILLRANLHVAGLGARATVKVLDYRDLTLPAAGGWTLFIGNPPYVRHHDISEARKDGYAIATAALGFTGASKLAGLHLHFFTKTGMIARDGDFALFVTAAEWMDTGYGRALRALLCGPLGGVSVHAVDARAQPFPGTLSTAVITVFAPHAVPSLIRFESVADVAALGDLAGGTPFPVAVAAAAGRWPPEGPALPAPAIAGRAVVRVGDLFRVHRGQVTGKNEAWLAGNGPPVPARFQYPCVTGAEEVFAAAAGGVLDPAGLRRVIDLPRTLAALTKGETAQVRCFLAWAQSIGAHESYVARHRSPWWSIRLREPAPIVCTYMARRPPAFVVNGGARLLNVAHGLYPRLALSAEEVREAVAALNQAFRDARGRVYAGGLTKFEPKAVEAIEIRWRPAASRPEPAQPDPVQTAAARKEARSSSRCAQKM